MKRENVSKQLWCFRIYHKSKSLTDTTQPHKGDKCERKVSGVRKQTTKKSPYSQSLLTLFLKAAYVEVQGHRFCLSIRNDSNRIVPHSEVKYCGDSIKLYHISPSHLEVEYVPTSSMTRFKHIC